MAQTLRVPRRTLGLVAAAVLGVTLSACSSGARDEQAEQIAKGSEIYYFEDIATMAATSDLVVKAKVSSVQPGRWIGEQGAPDSDQLRQVTLEIQAIHLDKTGTAPKTVTMDEGYWQPNGTGVQFERVSWTKPGHVGYYFLARTDVPNHYVLISSQGRMSLDGSVLASTADEKNPIFVQVASMKPARLETLIKQAGSDLAAGRLKPQKQFGSS